MKTIEYLKDVFTSWYLIGIMTLELLLCMAICLPILLMDKFYLWLILSFGLSIITISLQLIGRYHYQKNHDKTI